MGFENITFLSILFGAIFFSVSGFFLWKKYKTNKNKFLFILGLIFIISFIISIFSPRIISESQQYSEKSKVLFVIDLSKSMNVYDLSGNYSRLQITKDLIAEYVTQNSQNEYALTVFAGSTQKLLPFTQDIGLFQTILNGVSFRNVSVGGSNFYGLFDSFGLIKNQENENINIVIFTDGDDIESLKISDEQKKYFEKNNFSFQIIGVGTKKGGKIIDGYDLFGRLIYKQQNNEFIISQVNQSGIKTFARNNNYDSFIYDGVHKKDGLFEFISQNLIDSFIKNNLKYARDISYIFIMIFLMSFLVYIYFDMCYLGKK